MTRGRKVTMEEEKTKEKMVEDDKQQLVIEPTPEPVQPFCELIEEEEEKEDEQMRQTPIILSEREITEKEKKKKMKKGKRKKKKMRKMRKMKKKKVKKEWKK